MYFFILISLIGLIAWITTLVRIIKSDFKNSNDKVMWVVIVCVLGLIGAILYLIFGEKNRIKSISNNV
ncbi:MAG: PLDc N-terminal domain-containing protein [Spirosomaceae bacterium]|nr:PLDc N-terminal domain-containing protein [Spirosomataceae bacterium]